MFIDISKIKKCDGASVKIDCEIQFESLQFFGTDIAFLTPVRLTGSIKNVNNILYLHSSAECMIGVECARCLEKIEKEFRFTVEEQFSDAPSDEDITLLEGEEIDLKFVTEQQFCAALPISFLCDEDCKGLCLKCGQNLNIASCDCEDEDIDPRLAVFKNFKV